MPDHVPYAQTDHDLLIRLNVLADGMTSDINELKQNHSSHAAAIDARVRALEQFRWTILGGALVAGGLVGWLADAARHYVFGQ